MNHNDDVIETTNMANRVLKMTSQSYNDSTQQTVQLITNHLMLVSSPMHYLDGSNEEHFQRLFKHIDSCRQRDFRILFASFCGAAIVYVDLQLNGSVDNVEIYHYSFLESNQKPVLIRKIPRNCDVSDEVIMDCLKCAELSEILSLARIHKQYRIPLRTGMALKLELENTPLIRRNFVGLLSNKLLLKDDNNQVSSDLIADPNALSLVEENEIAAEEPSISEKVERSIKLTTEMDTSNKTLPLAAFKEEIDEDQPSLSVASRHSTKTRKISGGTEPYEKIRMSVKEIENTNVDSSVDSNNTSRRRSLRRRRNPKTHIITGTGFGCPNCSNILPFTGSGGAVSSMISDQIDDKSLMKPKDDGLNGLNRFPIQECQECGGLVKYEPGVGGILLKTNEHFKKAVSEESLVKEHRACSKSGKCEAKESCDELSPSFKNNLKVELYELNDIGTPQAETGTLVSTPLLEDDEVMIEHSWIPLALPDVPMDLATKVSTIEEELKSLKYENPNHVAEKTMQNKAKRIINQRTDQEKLLKIQENEQHKFRNSNSNTNPSRSSSPNEYNKIYNDLVTRTIIVVENLDENLKQVIWNGKRKRTGVILPEKFVGCHCCFCDSIEDLAINQNDEKSNDHILVPTTGIRKIDLDNCDIDDQADHPKDFKCKKNSVHVTLTEQHETVKKANMELAKYKPLLRKLEFIQWYNKSGQMFGNIRHSCK